MKLIIKNLLNDKKSYDIDISYDDYTNRNDISDAVHAALNLFGIHSGDVELRFYDDE